MGVLIRRGLWCLVLQATLISGSAFAQTTQTGSTLTGVVKDASGGVLPGVTVEASSLALIEKTRSAVTDSTGQYRITGLPPGSYTLTFSLSGFNSYKHADVQLSSFFTAAVDASLTVGNVSETVTVTGESPIVDVQGSRVTKTFDSETVAVLPNARQYYSFTALVPGLNIQGTDVGGALGPTFSVFQAHGGNRNEGRMQVDGAEVAFLGVSYYVADTGAAQEVTTTVSGGMGEAATGGPTLNIISRSGGNTFNGQLFANFANNSFASSNVTQALLNAGLGVPNALQKVWDASAFYGGPIRRDHIWFFVNARDQGSRNLLGGLWANANAGDPTKWTYQPDFNHQAETDGTWKNAGVRLTWQATPRNKFTVWWDEQDACRLCLPYAGTVTATASTSPDAQNQAGAHPERAARLSWSAPISNKLLLEANIREHAEQYGGPENGNTRALVRVVEQAGLIPNLNYRSQNWTHPYVRTIAPTGTVSYVTGAHSMKTGFVFTEYLNRASNNVNDNLLAYRFLNGAPNQLTMTLAAPIETYSKIRTQAAYAQDQSTFNRITLQGGVRYEHVAGYFPAEQIGPSKFLPTPIVFPEQDSPIHLHELYIRGGATLDVFGNRKSALKFSFGRYPYDVIGTTGVDVAGNPASNVATSTTRSWTDANGNFTADCDLLNPAAQDLRASLADVCGAWANQNFGKSVIVTNYDPSVTTGWGQRPYSWDFTATFQDQLASRVSVEVTYARRIYGNFIVTDNIATQPSDFSPYSITAPVDSRLPGGGGYVVSGLYDVNPNRFGQVNNLVRNASHYGNQTQHYNGFDFSINIRPRGGLTLQAGGGTGRTATDNCDVVSSNPQLLGAGVPLQYCHLQTPFLTNVNGLVGYRIPRLDVDLGATFQSKAFEGANAPTIASQSLAANWVVPNALVAPSLGRSLAGNAPNVTVNLVAPGTMYGDRINQLDIRVGRRWRLGGQRQVSVGVDLYNILNSNAVNLFNQTYGTSWLAPQSILTARFAKVSAQLTF